MTTGEARAPSAARDDGPGAPLAPLVYDERALPAELPLPEGPAPALWLVHTAPDAGLDPANLAVLDDEERARAAKFLRPADRDTYVSSHAALRRLLGAQLRLDPAALRFRREPCPCCDAPHGRPAVAGPPAQGAPHFSLSHTGRLALLGFARAPIGVDVEGLVADSVVADVAAALHPQERRELAALPAAGRPAAFARCWTRKEACLKGLGTGLAENRTETTLVGTGAHPVPVPGWHITDVRAPEGYAAACAVSTAHA